MDLLNTEKIESVVINEDNNTIEVIKRVVGGCYLLSNPPQKEPDRVYKQIYGVNDSNGKIELVKVIEGNVIPTSVIPERISFGEE